MATPFFEPLYQSISLERLNGYKVYPREPDEQIFDRYFWNLRLAKEFYPLIQNLEISLRNRIHSGASTFYSDEYWFNKPFMQHNQSRLIAEARQKVAKNKNINTIHVSAGAIIAELSFGFWVNLFNRPYNQFFLDVLVSVFLNVEKYKRKRDIIRTQLDDIRRFRNRIFHHEPIWNKNITSMHNTILETIYWLDPMLYSVTSKDSRFSEVYRNGIIRLQY